MNEVLGDLDSDSRCKDNYLLVKLNGILHSDDRLALLDIAWQLGLEKDINDRVAVREIFACTWCFPEYIIVCFTLSSFCVI